MEPIVEFIVANAPAFGVMAVLVLFASARGWLVWGHAHTQAVERLEAENAILRTDRDHWRDKAFDLLDIGDDVAHIASNLAEEAMK